MKVRIIRVPDGAVDGVTLRSYRPGREYDVPAVLAEYLVAEGYASIEMRRAQRSSRRRDTDRRRRR